MIVHDRTRLTDHLANKKLPSGSFLFLEANNTKR